MNDLLRAGGDQEKHPLWANRFPAANAAPASVALIAPRTIGWQHAEPVLRSLVQSLADFGAEQRVNGYAFDDQCYGVNLKLVKDSFAKLPSLWTSDDAAETIEVLETIRKSKAARSVRRDFLPTGPGENQCRSSVGRGSLGGSGASNAHGE